MSLKRERVFPFVQGPTPVTLEAFYVTCNPIPTEVSGCVCVCSEAKANLFLTVLTSWTAGLGEMLQKLKKGADM